MRVCVQKAEDGSGSRVSESKRGLLYFVHLFACFLPSSMAESPAQQSPESGPKREATAPAPAPAHVRPDPAFDRWRRKAAWVVGYGLSPEDEARRTEIQRLEQLDKEWSTCQKWKHDLMRNSPSVSYVPLDFLFYFY